MSAFTDGQGWLEGGPALLTELPLQWRKEEASQWTWEVTSWVGEEREVEQGNSGKE